jgi:hypothetical protein
LVQEEPQEIHRLMVEMAEIQLLVLLQQRLVVEVEGLLLQETHHLALMAVVVVVEAHYLVMQVAVVLVVALVVFLVFRVEQTRALVEGVVRKAVEAALQQMHLLLSQEELE